MLPPARLDADAQYHTVLRIGDAPTAVTLFERDGNLVLRASRTLRDAESTALHAAVTRIFRLDDDLAPFYALVAEDSTLAWARVGAGRLLASPSVFEDVIKTICTTNCSWSGTTRMVSAAVELGGGAFATAAALAAAPETWYREVARMGYRGPYVRRIACEVVDGRLDLERLRPLHGLDDEAVADALLGLPGIGPYAAAHAMQLLGRHRLLVLDSWTRPRYLELTKKKRASDATICRAFRKYAEYAGLAFWLLLTRSWLDDTVSSSARPGRIGP